MSETSEAVTLEKRVSAIEAWMKAVGSYRPLEDGAAAISRFSAACDAARSGTVEPRT
jgi:hypothetical protein